MGKKILFIEDEPDQIMVIKTRLEASGYEVITANDGATGLQLAKEEHPDLVLLDIVMPGMDGIEVCSRLRASEKTRDIPVIAITASGEKSMEDRCITAGCNYVVKKPYDSKRLLEIIGGLLK